MRLLRRRPAACLRGGRRRLSSGRINPPDNPARLFLPADWRVLCFGLVLTVLVTLFFGLTPALRASSVKPSSALKGGENSHSRRRVMHALMAAQVAFCFLVLFVAGLFAATLDRLSNRPMGFSAERVLTLETVAQRAQPPVLWEQVSQHLRYLPGIEKVALAGWPSASILRREVSRARSEFRDSNIRTQAELVRAQTIRERLLSLLTLFFAGVALLLAGVGLYGVLDYSVLEPRREIGIRIAIGAPASDIARRVTVEVFSMVLIGAIAGLASGLISVRYIESLLYQVKPSDLTMLALPSCTILASALLDALPAVLRAVRIDPVAMLRVE